MSPLVYFSSNSATMTLSDGRTTTLHVGDVVNLKDDHQYRVLNFFAPAGPIVFKRLDGSTQHRSFLFNWGIDIMTMPRMKELKNKRTIKQY